jgi:predicted RND superfamily exporter protein
VAGKLVSLDGTSTIIVFTFENGSDIKAVANRVFKKVNELDLPENIYFAGSTFLTTYIADIISGDMLKLIPISFLLISLILFLSFRSIRGVVLPLLTAGLAIVWSIGTFVLMGFKLSMVTNNVPIIILAVGSAYTIHVLNRVNQNKKKNNKKSIVNAMSLIAVPVILASLTTMIGFLSFIFGSYLSMIRDFGIMAALGTFYAALLALVFVPAILSIFPVKRKKVKSSIVDRQSIMNRYLLFPLYQLVIKHPKRIISVWVILVLIGIVGIFMIKRSVSSSDYFKPNHPASIADKIMDEKFGGSKPVYAIFTGDMQSPALLKGMYDFEKYLLASPYISSAQSIADIVVKLNKAFGDEEKIPDDEGSIQQLWFILGQQNLSQLVTEDLDQGIIMAKFNNQGQTHIKEFTAYVQSYLDTHKSEEYTIQVTGMPYVNWQLDKSLVRSQITSLVIAIILVIAVVSLIFGSFIEGLYASVPIVATIIILYGFMGLTGIPLNIVTVLVASVAMGIGIDYSIHFISNFNLSLKKRGNLNKAVEDAMLVSGKAILINFLSVSIGFLVLVFSDFVPMILFGFLIALSMLGSSMGAITLLPSVLLVGKRKLFVEQDNKPIK